MRAGSRGLRWVTDMPSRDLLRPVDPTGLSTFYAHTRRTPPSKEAGVDYYCPRGTPIRAAGNGVIRERGGSTYPATGRWVGLDLDGGGSVRYLHLSQWGPQIGGTRVSRGEIIAWSGMSGYGSEFFGAASPNDPTMLRNTGGAHTHTSLFPVANGWNVNVHNTLDIEQYIGGGSVAGGKATPLENLMAKLDDEDRAWLDALIGSVRVLLQVPGQPYGWPQANNNVLQALDPLVRDTQNRVRGGDPRGDMLQLIREDLGKPITATVDSSALAKELAPLLVTHPEAVVAQLADADLARIANAVADVQAKRLTS